MTYVSTGIGAAGSARSRRRHQSRNAIAASDRLYYFTRKEPKVSTSGYVGDCGDAPNYCDGLGFSLKPPKAIRKAVAKVGTFVKKHETALIVGAGIATAGLLAPGAAAVIARGALSAGGALARGAAAGGRAILKPLESLVTKKATAALAPMIGPPVPSSSSGPWANPDAYNGTWDAIYANPHKRQESIQNDAEFAAWAQWKATGVLPSATPAPAPVPSMPTLTLPGQTGGSPTADYSGGGGTGIPSYGGETPATDQAVDTSAPAQPKAGMNPVVIIGGIALLGLVLARSRKR